MRTVNAEISQELLVLLIFFNAELVEAYEQLNIKILIIKFVNDVNILVYGKTTVKNYVTLYRVYDIYTQ